MPKCIDCKPRSRVCSRAARTLLLVRAELHGEGLSTQQIGGPRNSPPITHAHHTIPRVQAVVKIHDSDSDFTVSFSIERF